MLGRVLKDLLAPKARARPGGAAFDAGVAAFGAGDHAAAARHFAEALQADPENAEVHYLAGGVAFREARYQDALGHFERARQLEPGEAQYHFDAAVAHWQLGAMDTARERCEAALALAPALEPAHGMLASLSLPGATYTELLPLIHSHLRPRTYLEIGVDTGRSIALARAETRAIGIDPEPKIAVPLGPRTSVVAETSDNYFATHDVRAEFEGLPVDLAFIDGMHQFEFALRDFINVERLADPSSTVLIHDCYPLSRLTAERERQTTFWSGDIWRLIVLLRKYRPDLKVNVLATAPTGLGVVRGLDPGSRLLGERYGDIVREFLALDYSALDADKPGMLALYPNDWEKIKVILGHPQ